MERIGQLAFVIRAQQIEEVEERFIDDRTFAGENGLSALVAREDEQYRVVLPFECAGESRRDRRGRFALANGVGDDAAQASERQKGPHTCGGGRDNQQARGNDEPEPETAGNHSH